MKNFLIEKSLLLIGTISSLFLVVQKEPSHITEVKEKNVISKPVISTIDTLDTVDFVKKDTIDVDAILKEAKETVRAYNKSVEEKNRTNERLLNLTKKEVTNAKKTSKLINELIQKYKLAKYNENNNKTLSEVKVDSTCSKYRKYIFGSKRCVEWEHIYYIYKGNDRINLQTINR